MSDLVSFTVKPEALAIIRDLSIEANFDECKAALTEKMEPYKALVVTEDGIAEAKADRAKIRKVASQIDEMRKSVKRAYSEPLTIFEARCKELMAICDEGSGNLDGQIKAFEERERAEKVETLHAYFTETIPADVVDFLTWERVFDARWGNKTFSEDEAKAAITEAINRCWHDIIAIRGFGSADVAVLLDYYKQTHDLSATLTKKREIDAMRAAEAARAAAASEKAETAKGTEPEAKPQSNTVEKASIPAAPVSSDVFAVEFRVIATREQLAALKEFLVRNGIKYGKVTGK